MSIIVVALYHAFPDTLPGGFVGVDVFFVISGYIITRLLAFEIETGTISYRKFLMRRIRRLWPVLATVSICVLGVALVGMAPRELVQLSEALGSMVGISANWYFYYTTDYFNEALNNNLLLHSWSLTVEEQFYLVFPLFLMAVFPHKRMLWLALVIMVVLSYSMSVDSALFGGVEGAFFATHLRAWELGVGALLAVFATALRSHDRFRKNSALFSATGLTLIVLSSVLISGNGVTFPGYIAIVPTLGAALCILAGSSKLETPTAPATFLENRGLVYVGKLSYSLYLWHWPLLQFLELMVHDPDDMQIALTLVASFALSVLSYHFIEHPIRKRKVLASDRSLFAVYILGSAFLLACAASIIVGKGFPARIPPAAISVLETGMDTRTDAMECGQAPAVESKYLTTSVFDKFPDKQILCIFGDSENRKPDLFLWGDSHLAAIAPSVAKAASEAGLFGVIAYRGACPSLVGSAWSALPPAAARQCAVWNDRVVELISALGPIRVFLVSHWDTYAPNDGGFLNSKRPGKLQQAPTEQTDFGKVGPLGLFDTAFRHTIRRIERAADIFVLLDVPTHGFSAPDALARSIRWPWLPEPDWITPIEQRQRQENYVPVMTQEASLGKLRIIDPVPLFCPGERCLAEIDMHPLFFDSSHVNQQGAELLVDFLKDYFIDE